MAHPGEFERRRPAAKIQTSTPDGKRAGRRQWAKPPVAFLAGRRGSLDAPKKRVRHHWSGSGKDGQNQRPNDPVLPNAPRDRKQCRHSPSRFRYSVCRPSHGQKWFLNRKYRLTAPGRLNPPVSEKYPPKRRMISIGSGRVLTNHSAVSPNHEFRPTVFRYRHPTVATVVFNIKPPIGNDAAWNG